ncbi:sigma-70 family RNA polymerase sigma factor [Actinopolymorpha sp. B17G11]|uniref:RNA polymerase sigma factor n=1 Tax=unclassified Actinopolymorpha TaxID=2627063 RepID=UPI0032D926D1
MVIARVRSGDREAYADLVRRHSAIAHRTAVLLGAGSDADDVVQIAFVKAYRALGGFRAGSAFRPWLLRIVANETSNAVRAAKRRRDATLRSVDGLDDAAPDPASDVLSSERRATLLAAVRELPEPQRRAVVCRYLLELDEEETSTVLGWPRGTVKSRLHRALGRLRTRLAETAEPLPGAVTAVTAVTPVEAAEPRHAAGPDRQAPEAVVVDAPSTEAYDDTKEAGHGT